MKRSKSKQLNIGIIPATLILSVITFLFIMLVTKTSNQSTINQVSTSVVPSEPSIQSTADLDRVTQELDSYNPDSLDQDLKTLSTESSAL
jgi:hypothetical protein